MNAKLKPTSVQAKPEQQSNELLIFGQ